MAAALPENMDTIIAGSGSQMDDQNMEPILAGSGTQVDGEVETGEWLAEKKGTDVDFAPGLTSDQAESEGSPLKEAARQANQAANNSIGGYESHPAERSNRSFTDTVDKAGHIVAARKDMESPHHSESLIVQPGTPNRTDDEYYIRWIKFPPGKISTLTPVVMQNANGPCPGIALINVLLLRGDCVLSSDQQIITGAQLLSELSELLIKSQPKVPDTNWEQNLSDALNSLPNLLTGLDVNVKFTAVDHFEFTGELAIFDLLRVPVYHGWLVDPQDVTLVQAVGLRSYNQLVEFVINGKNSDNEDTAAEAVLCEEFLNLSASQLTYHGLCELTSRLADSQLSVFFRNNHFSTLLMFDERLYTLITDQSVREPTGEESVSNGYLTEDTCVWETLDTADGDTVYLNDQLNVGESHAAIEDLQINNDYLMAMQLEEDEARQAEQASWSSGNSTGRPGQQQNAQHSGNSSPSAAAGGASQPKMDHQGARAAPENMTGNNNTCEIL